MGWLIFRYESCATRLRKYTLMQRHITFINRLDRQYRGQTLAYATPKKDDLNKCAFRK